MLGIKEYSYVRWYKLFRPQYRQAGKLREIQVNYLILTQNERYEQEFRSFLAWLGEKELRSVKKFIQLAKKIKTSELMLLEKTIFKFCQSSSISGLRSKTKEFIRRKANKVQKLQSCNTGNEELHQIRIHLKTMSAILTTINTIKSGRELGEVLSSLNKTEMMFGDWHDRIVLKEAIEKFLASKPELAEDELIAINKLKNELIDQSRNLVDHFMPEIDVIVGKILTNTL